MPSMTTVEAYAIIGVKKSASEAEIKSAYKKLALRTHPDKNPNDPDASKNFLRVSEAYKRITDPSSFHEDDDDGENINEEDFTSMCNMMFAEMFSGSDGEMFDFFGDDGNDDDEDYDNDEMDMLRAMEMMMGGGKYDDEDNSYDECGIGERTIDEKLINLISRMSVGDDFLGGGQSKMPGGAKMKSKLSRHSQSKSSHNPDYDSNDDADEVEMGISENDMMMMMMQSMMTGSSPALGAGRSSRDKKGRESSDCKTDEKDRDRVKGKSKGKHAGDGTAFDDMAGMLEMLQAMEKAAGKFSIRSSGKPKNNPKESRHRINGDGDSDEEEGDWETASEDDDEDGEEGEWETASEDESDEEEVKAEQSPKGMVVKGSQKRANTSDQSVPLKRTVAQVSAPSVIEHIDVSVKSSSMTSTSSGSLSSESKSSVPTAEHEKNIAVGDRVLVNSKYQGTVMFSGEVHYAKGIFYGVVVDDKTYGKNNGVLKGVKYFDSPASGGLMLRIDDLRKM